MKKDIEVNDCETPHPTHHTTTTTPKKRERKIETSAELSKLLIGAPSVPAEHPAKSLFLQKRKIRRKKRKIFCLSLLGEKKSIKCI